MYCQKCGKPVIHVLSFEKGKCREFYRCHFCWTETKHKPFNLDLEIIQKGIE